MRTHRMQAQAWADNLRDMFVDVVDDAIVYVCKNHVMLSREDWDKIQTRLMRTTTEGNLGNEATTRSDEEQECSSSGRN